jgi:hypothetical protein
VPQRSADEDFPRQRAIDALGATGAAGLAVVDAALAAGSMAAGSVAAGSMAAGSVAAGSVADRDLLERARETILTWSSLD